MGAGRHELPITVEAGDLDDLGHVNNVVYLRWMQQVAESHWRQVARLQDRERIAWVVRRHEVDYLQAAFPDERLVGRTWVGQWSGATCERFVEIRRADDDRLLARARTVWVAVDPRTGRPQRIGPEVAARFRTDH